MIIRINKYDTARIVGFIFIGIGFLFVILDIPVCNSLCNFCEIQNLSPCFLLFLFVGIIFLVDGAAIILIYSYREKEGDEDYQYL